MKKIVSALLLALCLCAVVVTGFPQKAFAAHAYLTIKDIQCPTVSDGYFVRYILSWKSEEEVPSIPEVNEMTKFWPSTSSDGDCGPGTNRVINVNQKFQFPVDLDMELEPAVGEGSTPLSHSIIPATQNYEGTTTATNNGGGYKTIINYSVTFE
ncbi:hypothetical protein PCC7424_4422 [Gloeothece citriformis PCC 7424]|uniref:Uncharacterized protein n=1 Tax=Gloeothece citriformis (strain PCC 7424) TaxID=65393 RepID=B7K917_GLOC7|nr:hypothetical protein [Gloeothece citriformis]ACK72786.1 hypothetical protein PCC7424_4422 [Gloeothece citriformis PCC 7424]